MNINIGFMRDFNLKVMLFSLGLKLNTKLGLHTHPPPTHHQSSARDHTEISITCICLGILLFP